MRRALFVALFGLLVPARVAAQTEIVDYYGTDAIGSVRIVFDAAGNVVGRMDYGPFGEQLSASTVGHKSYAGLFRDGEAGMDYAEARSYQVRTGRFGAPDPVYSGLFEPQAWNRYSYAGNNPITFIDATGLQKEGPTKPRLCSAENSFERCGGSDAFWDTDSGGLGFGDAYAGALDRGYIPGMPSGIWESLQSWFEASQAAFDRWALEQKAKAEVTAKFRTLRECVSSDDCFGDVQLAASPQAGAAAAAIGAAQALGRHGEQLVKNVFVIGTKVQMLINGNLRIPDGALRTGLSEVKNVRYQPWTHQLSDYALESLSRGRPLDLYVRTNTVLSSGVIQAQQNGMVRVLPVLPKR